MNPTCRCMPLPIHHPDERVHLQMLNVDIDSNLWVAGNGYVTKVFTSQITAGSSSIPATLDGTAINIALSTSAVHDPIPLNLAAHLGSVCSDPTESCCTSGTFDAGIVIVDSLSTIYAANTCPTGLVGFPPCSTTFFR